MSLTSFTTKLEIKITCREAKTSVLADKKRQKILIFIDNQITIY